MNPPPKVRDVALSELQQLWQLSFQKTKRGITVSEADSSSILAANPSFAQMHGGEPGDFVGRRLSEFVAPAFIAEIPSVLDTLEKEGFVAFESEHLRLDGSALPIGVELTVAADASGKARYRIGWFVDLSARREEEKRRRKAERSFEAAFAQGAAGMALLDTGRRWLRANAAFCEITGYSEDELRALEPEAIIHPEDREANRGLAKRLLAGEVDDFRIEQRYLRRDGTAVWVLLAVSLLRDDDGEALNYVLHAYDISLRKRVEEELSVVGASAAPKAELMCTITLDGEFEIVHGDWTTVLGWTPDELRTRTILDLAHPEDRREVERALLSAPASDEGWRSFRSRWTTRTGEVVELAGSAFIQEDRQRISCILRAVNDRLAIERAYELRGQVIANMAEGVCLVTAADSRIAYANPSLERMLGYEVGTLAGRPAREVMEPPDLSPDELEERRRAERELRDTGSSSYEGRRRRADGTAIWCRTATTTFEHPRYGPIWVAIQHDIGGERRAREAAEQLERAKTQFLGSVSHELRTPLTSILGYLALLRQDVGDLGQSGEHLDVIERNANRELRLVDDLLSIARLGAGEFEIELASVDIEAVVGAAVEEMQPAAASARLSLDLTAKGPLMVEGDADRLAQVVTNLVSNAIKFSPDGGVVRVELREREGRALLVVSDTGIGIAAADRDDVFQRLFRGEQALRQQIDGAGLGLSIARSIVEAHGGTIGLVSSSGGSTFEVSLPLAGS